MLERLPMVAVRWKPPRKPPLVSGKVAGSAKAKAEAEVDGEASDDALCLLEVELQRQRGGRAAARVHAPRFPKAR